MISKIIIRGDYKDGSYAEYKSGDILYFYPCKNSSTNFKYGKSLKITSPDYEIDLDLNNGKNFVKINNNKILIDFEYIYSSNIFIIDKFVEVKNTTLKNTLILVVFKWLFYCLYYSILVDTPLLILHFIKNQPIGIKQNTIINEFLSLVCHTIIYFQKQVLSHCSLLFILAHKEKMFLRLSISITTLFYKTIVDRIVDIAELFNNKTYNILKKRYDTIKLSLDQIIMCVLFFSISILILPSLLCYFLVHKVFYISIQALEALELTVILLFVDTKDTFYFDKSKCKFLDVDFKGKCGFIMEFVIRKCLMCYDIKKMLRG